MTETFDHIVIGAGSAGAVVASRLSEDPKVRVLLLEAGGMDNHPGFRLPLLMGAFVRSGVYNWSYQTDPEPHLNDRQIPWPRGKVIGGSSTLNGMVYIRGVPGDYDGWAQMGLPGWGWDEVLPYFRRAEAHEDREGALHATNGAMTVRRARGKNKLTDAFIKAGGEAGYPVNDDFNGTDQEGFGRFDFTIRDGKRCGTARAYVRPAMSRPNMELRTRALTTRLLIEDGRCEGVEYKQGGVLKRARVTGEVIVSGGAINSPQILMLSGIGPAEHLREMGIDPVLDLPGVGQNLQDHFDCGLEWEATQPVSLTAELRIDRVAVNLLRGALAGVGPATVFPYEGGAFLKVNPGSEDADIQVHFMHGREATSKLHLLPGKIEAHHGFTVRISQTRPESRGWLKLRSKSPEEAPSMIGNYLAAQSDIDTTIAGVRALRRVVAQPAFDPYRGREVNPGEHVDSDAEITAWLRETGATTFHQSGTCAMGQGPMAVLDERLRVRGIRGLRVADASVMPRIVTGNTNAPSIMIGERAADFVRQDAR
ncbi:MAG: choline dehydrogenase [Pseudomonadota bacterium]|nr:choline dehydrogenase [Pseudomonadota bacterium]